MKKVLLILPPDAYAPNAIDAALESAAERNAGLLAVALLDPNMSSRVSRTLANVGFVGEKVCDSVSETLAREQRAHAEGLLESIAARAVERGIDFDSTIEEGDLDGICGKLARSHAIDLVILVAEKRSLITRFLSRSADVALPALAGCEVKLVED